MNKSIKIPNKIGIRAKTKCFVHKHGLNGLFYESRGDYFNLPIGEYHIYGSFEFTEPISFELNEMPPIEKNGINFYNRHKLIVSPNPNKAQIDIRKNIIYIDPSFYKKGSAMTEYILSHELGHHFYNTEEFCDAYAENRLLKLGYNPHQFMSKFFEFMSKNKEARIRAALKRMKKWERKQ